MRIDFTGGQLANSWFPTDLIQTKTINFEEIQGVLNDIQFNLFYSYEKIVDECGGEGFDKETSRYVYTENYNYWIRLIPIKDSYHMYISVYEAS